MGSFDGRWLTTFGPMTLTQEGTRIQGFYYSQGAECPILGQLNNGRFTFTYREPTEEGEGWFELRRRGKALYGQYRAPSNDHWQPWDGEHAGFDGLWNTSFGPLRLVEDGDRIVGSYLGGGLATLQGHLKGDRLVFRYREPKTRGRGQFVVSEDGLSFQGDWQVEGESVRQPWHGLRVRPQPDRTWLVVLEAPWQRFLSDKEYAFGHMLREFFARLPHVQVRHRFFANEPSLLNSLRDLAFLAEPIVLVLASHGETDGVRVNGQTIPMETVLQTLRTSGDVRQVHFSACLTMKEPSVLATLQDFSNETGTTVSGYATSVNWAASALIEFTFLELILGHGRVPLEAAEHLHKLLPFAGDEGVPGGAFHPAGFRLVSPGKHKSASRRRTNERGA